LLSVGCHRASLAQGGMKELIDEKIFVAVLSGAAIFLVVLGAVVALIGWRLKRAASQIWGIALIIAGPALWLLWLAYGGVTKHFGLDSVKGLGLSILIFAAAGVVVGVVIGLLRRRA